MQIYIGADHRGFQVKDQIKEALRNSEFNVTDLSNEKFNPDDDFPDIALKLGEKVVIEKAMGILICGSGVGMCIATNKVKGVRGALCTSEKQARLAREDNNANVLCLSAMLTNPEVNINISKVFLETVFSPTERFIRRIKKIENYETT